MPNFRVNKVAFQLTRFGESGVYGFLEHLDSRAAAELLLQSITTEARQQMIFRQFEGLFPMPVRAPPRSPIMQFSLTSLGIDLVHTRNHTIHGLDVALALHRQLPSRKSAHRLSKLPGIEHSRPFYFIESSNSNNGSPDSRTTPQQSLL